MQLYGVGSVGSSVVGVVGHHADGMSVEVWFGSVECECAADEAREIWQGERKLGEEVDEECS